MSRNRNKLRIYNRSSALHRRREEEQNHRRSAMDNPDFEPANHAQWRQYIFRRTRDPNYTHAMIRRLFERAVESVPPVEREVLWYSHYISLWIMYIQFEEYKTGDLERVSLLYTRILDLIPHDRFSFENIWISAANFEIDRLNLQKAVTILESAMEKAATNRIFKLYVDLKIELKKEEEEEPDINKCRTLFGNLDHNDYVAWLIYIEFERLLCTPDRVRSTFDMVLNKPQFYECEELWEFYINFELSLGEFETGRYFFEEFLLHKNDNRIIWFYYTKFVASIAELLFKNERFEDEVQKRKGKKVDYSELYVELVRDILKRGICQLEKSKRTNSVIYLLEASRNVERRFEKLGITKLAPADENVVFSNHRTNRCNITLGQN